MRIAIECCVLNNNKKTHEMVLFRSYNLLEFKGKLQLEIRVNGFQNTFYAVALMFTYFRQNANITKLITL